MPVRSPLLVLGGFLLSVVAVACGNGNGSGSMAGHDMGGGTLMAGSTMASPTAMASGMMHSPSPSRDLDLDLAFIDGMIVHHQSAVDMTKVAQEKAEHPEIKMLADAIIAAQQREIDQMNAWRSQWFPNAPRTGGMPGMEHAAGMQMSESDMQMLRNAAPFDKTFIDMMIPHHQSAIEMAKELQKTTSRPELRQLTDAIIAEQQREISQMQQWKAAWYGS